MNVFAVEGALALSLVLAACGRTEKGTEGRQSAEPAEAPQVAAQVHSASGTVKVIGGDQVTIAHGAIPSIGWPAMTMSFKTPTGIPQGVRAGTQVRFSFREDDGGYVLTSIKSR